MDASLQNIAILLVVLLVSMSIHEMMHAFAADRLGDPTARLMGRVSFNPIAHIDPFMTVLVPLLLLISGSPYLFGAAKPVQVNFHRLKYGELGGAIVGMIGPLINLVIAVGAAFLFNSMLPAQGTTTYDIFRITIILNVGLFIFNSIPWPPLDGSRLLYAFAPDGLREIMENIERTGLMSLFIFIFIFYSLLQGPIGNLMARVVLWLAPGLQF